MTLDPLRFAKYFATNKHAAGKYPSYGVLPYTHHLSDVEKVLRRFGIHDVVFLTAAWLHDTLEDTNTKLKEIVELFGPEVAALVLGVTNMPGPTRAARSGPTYQRIRSTPGATCLKLADRIANVENGGDLVGMYASEYPAFRQALYVPGENEEMWKHLDSLLLGAKV